MNGFRWQDGERLIVFGRGAADQVWSGAELFTTRRALAEAPAAITATATAVRIVPAGQVPEAAAAVAAEAAGERIVAFGGGRVIDVAKAVAAARGGAVCAVPTTLSAAEMSSRHRSLPGFEQAPPVRPRLVLNDPDLSAAQPPDARRQSAANALGHGVQALASAGRNPVASLAAERGLALLREGLEAGSDERPALAEGALLTGYAIGSAGLGLHHAICQTLVRSCHLGHAATNAVMLPHTAAELLRRYPDQLAAAARALAVPPSRLEPRLAGLGGGGRLRDLGVAATDLDPVARAAAARDEIRAMSDPPDAAALHELLVTAW